MLGLHRAPRPGTEAVIEATKRGVQVDVVRTYAPQLLKLLADAVSRNEIPLDKAQ